MGIMEEPGSHGPVMSAKGTVDPEAHGAATSPHNDLADPSKGQKDAGNYAMGHIRVGGLGISIENPAGSVRSGVTKEGRPWRTELKDHYGYFKRTEGKDGDQLDVFVKPGTSAEHDGPVYIINQNDPASGKFDEHKVVMGAADPQEARDIYHRNYQAGWKGFGSMVAMPLERFKKWAEARKRIAPAGGKAMHQAVLMSPRAKLDEPEYLTPREAPPVRQVAPIGIESSPVGQIIGDGRAWFREHAADIAGKMPPEFTLSARAIGKLRQVNLQDGESPLAHFQAIGSLPDLLANSQPIMRTPDEASPSSHDVAFYERRYAWARFPDGARRHVLLTVRYLTKDSEPPRMYSLEALEVRNASEALHEGVPGGQTAPSPSSPVLGETLADFMDGVKPEHRQSKPAPGLAPSQEAGLAPAPGPLEESQTVVNPSPQPTPNDNQRGMQGQSLFAPRANPDDGIINPAPFGFNTLDRALASTVARAVTAARQSPPGQAVENFIAHSYEHTAPGNLVKKTVDFLKAQFVPLSVLPREARALLSEMRIKQAFAQQNAMDITRALSGRAKFSDIAFPARYAGNPAAARQLWEAMDTVNLEEVDARARIAALPADLQRMATYLRGELVAAGQDATRAGIISWETFERLAGGYLPHYYENDIPPLTPTPTRVRGGCGASGTEAIS